MTRMYLNKASSNNKGRTSIPLIRVLLIMLVVVIALRICFWPTRVDGHSMEETLFHNDIVVISKIPTFSGDYTYDDLVVVEVPDLDGNNERVVKRVIGLPGDHVIINEDVLWINGQLIEETYKKGYMDENLDYYVPSDSYFILGDSRSLSRDSRTFGCVQEKQITELVLFKLF